MEMELENCINELVLKKLATEDMNFLKTQFEGRGLPRTTCENMLLSQARNFPMLKPFFL